MLSPSGLWHHPLSIWELCTFMCRAGTIFCVFSASSWTMHLQPGHHYDGRVQGLCCVLLSLELWALSQALALQSCDPAWSHCSGKFLLIPITKIIAWGQGCSSVEEDVVFKGVPGWTLPLPYLLISMPCPVSALNMWCLFQTHTKFFKVIGFSLKGCCVIVKW